MVQIDSPWESQPPQTSPSNATEGEKPCAQVAMGSSPVDSQAITEDGMGGSSSNGDGQYENRIATANDARGFADSPPSSDEPTLAGPPPAWQDEAGWQSSQTRRTRQIVMIATLAISTLCITILTFGWFVRSQRRIAKEAIHADSKTDVIEADEPIVDPFAMQDAESDSESPDPEVKTPADAAPEANDPSEIPVQAQPSPEAESGMPESLMPESLIPKSLIPTSPIDEPAATTEIEPSTSLIPPNQQTTDDSEAATMQELPAGLRKFTPFLLQEGPAEVATLKAPPTIEQVEIDAAAEEDSSTLGIDPPDPINVRKDLGVKIALNSDGYPLPSLVLLLSQMTGVPIQLDWASFDMVGVDVEKRIKVVGKARTVREWLDTVAQQVGGEVREEQFLIVITIDDETFAASETALTDLADFGEQSDSAKAVIKEFMNETGEQVVKKNVGELEEDENEENEAKPPLLGPREASQLRILAVELLRRMRSIPPHLSDQRASRWLQIKPSNFSDWQILEGQNVGKQVATPITTSELFRSTAAANNAVCLVNWHDANRRGMRPNRLVMPNAGFSDAGKMLSAILSPLSLQVRTVDENHWWVGSGATYDRLPVLVHSEPLADQRQAYVKQIDGIMGEAGRDVYRTAYDPVSDRMMMLLPRFVARQLPKVAQNLALK